VKRVRRGGTNRFGFTLIELLIVVAIIGILAAIAIPNFLQAQIRAKVSRCYADMKTLRTAMEVYHVDHDYYPHGLGNGFPPYPEGPVKYRLWRLTTPIDYLASLPDDPFKTQFKTAGFLVASDKPSFIYLIRDWDGDGIPGHPFELYAQAQPALYSVLPNPAITEYVLVSKGPQHEQIVTLFWIPYDPTNGTISNGEIITGGP